MSSHYVKSSIILWPAKYKLNAKKMAVGKIKHNMFAETADFIWYFCFVKHTFKISGLRSLCCCCCISVMIQINVINVQKEHIKLLFAELWKTVCFCCISMLVRVCVCVCACVRACVFVCVRACVQCQLICFGFQQVKHTCESSSCCFEEPKQGKQRQRKRNVLLSPFFLQPFSSPVSRLFC